MSTDTLFYGLIIFTFNEVLLKSSLAMSSPLRAESASSLLLFNPSSHDLDPFEYAVKRESTELRNRDQSDSLEIGRRKDPPGWIYARHGRNREEINSGYNNNDQSAAGSAGEKTSRGRMGDVVRFGRSNSKIPRHEDELQSALRPGRGYVRFGRSGSSEYARLGRGSSNSVTLPSDAEMAVLCSNILVEDDRRANNEELQIYFSKLIYICNNNNNDNNAATGSNRGTGAAGIDGNIEDNLHRNNNNNNNNLEYFEVNRGDSV